MTRRRTIAAVTVARSDFGLYVPLLERLRVDEAVELRLLAGGSHFDPRFGPTIAEIEARSYAYERIEMPAVDDSPGAIAASLGEGVKAFAGAFAARRPDLLLVLGDRVEMACAPVAALPFNIPVAHLYGGKITEGAVDELVRHALTKMSHLHFVTTEVHARRVKQMGEESWRVFNFGSPGLDRLYTEPRAGREAVCAGLGLDPERPILLVTFHPVSLEPSECSMQVGQLIEALAAYSGQVVMTYPNADAGHSEIISAMERFARTRASDVRLVKNAGARRYFDLMAAAAAMVGNSSSGIAEAPSFELPVVNIGSRQAGFERAANVIDVSYSTRDISEGIARATHPDFRARLRGLRNPYGDGRSSERIAAVLRDIPIDDRLLRKKFIDLRDATA